jgi:hypothetical protein
MEKRRELRVAPGARAEAELARDREREIDDVAAVGARVGVVRLDDVAEQERRPAVGGAELEDMVDPHLALPCEDRQQEDEREGQEQAVRIPHRGERHGETDRSQSGVDEPHEAHGPELDARRHPEREAFVRRRAHEVEGELSGERGEVERDCRDRRGRLSRQAEDERGTKRVPAVGERNQDPLEMDAAAPVLDEVGEQHSARDHQRHPADRHDEEHRDEDDLGRYRRAGSHLEVEHERQRVGADEQGHDRRSRRAIRGGEQERRECRRSEEAAAEERGGRALARGEAARPARAPVVDRVLGVWIERRPRPNRAAENVDSAVGHTASEIGLDGRLLDSRVVGTLGRGIESPPIG